LQNRIFEIHTEVREVGSGPIRECQRRLLHENRNDVWSQRADFDVAGALAEFERANDGVRDDAESNAFQVWCRTGEFWIPFDHNFVVLTLADELKWPGPGKFAREVSARVCGHDTRRRANEIDRKRSVRFFEMKNHRRWIGRVDRGHKAKRAAL